MNLKLSGAVLLSLSSELLDYPDQSTSGIQRFCMECENLKLSAENIEDRDLALSELESEYIRLFAANFKGAGSPPYASFYAEKRIMGRAAVNILNFYQDCGYEFNADAIKGPPDHISLELAFLSRLLEEGQTDSAALMIANHLNWLSLFETSVKNGADMKFYPSILGASIRAVELIKENLC